MPKARSHAYRLPPIEGFRNPELEDKFRDWSKTVEAMYSRNLHEDEERESFSLVAPTNTQTNLTTRPSLIAGMTSTVSVLAGQVVAVDVTLDLRTTNAIGLGYLYLGSTVAEGSSGQVVAGTTATVDRGTYTQTYLFTTLNGRVNFAVFGERTSGGNAQVERHSRMRVMVI